MQQYIWDTLAKISKDLQQSKTLSEGDIQFLTDLVNDVHENTEDRADALEYLGYADKLGEIASKIANNTTDQLWQLANEWIDYPNYCKQRLEGEFRSENA